MIFFNKEYKYKKCIQHLNVPFGTVDTLLITII